MRTTLRRRLGALATIFGLSLTVLSLTAAPANAYTGECTATDADSGTCGVVEFSGSGVHQMGTATYEIDHTAGTLTFDFDGVDDGTDIQACVTVDSGQANPYDPPEDPDPPASWQPCAGNTPDRIYEGDYVDPLVLDLDDVTGWDSGDPVFFAIHVNQGGSTTYVIGGGDSGGDPDPGDVTIEKDTTGAGAPTNGTPFHFSVDCSVNAHDDNDVAVGSNGAAVTAVDDAPAGTTCRIRETSLQGAVDVSFTGGTTGSDTTGDYTDVTVGDGTTVAVTALNTYRCVNDPQTPGDECNPIPPCVDDPQTPGDDCNPIPPCVDNPSTAVNECTGITPQLPQLPFDVLPQEVVNEPAPAVEAEVITPTPPAAVAGVQQTRPAALARTGLSQGQTMTLAIGGALLVLGGMCLFGSSLLTPRTRRIG